jgi:hypothetical protein
MKNKNTILIIVLVLLLLSLLIYLGTKPEKTFKRVELSNKNFVLNQGSRPYLDTIVQVGLDKIGIENHTLLIKEQTNEINLGDEIFTEAFIIYKNNQSIIFIKPSLKRTNAIKIISHELVHLQQYLDKRLIILGNGIVCWENDTINLSSTPYDKRPWENEAFNYGPLLEEDIKSILYE